MNKLSKLCPFGTISHGECGDEGPARFECVSICMENRCALFHIVTDRFQGEFWGYGQCGLVKTPVGNVDPETWKQLTKDGERIAWRN